MNRRFTFPEEETLMANKYTKICSTSLGIREMQIEIKISFYTHKIGKTKCGWRCGTMGTHLLLAGASTGAQALQKRSRVTPRGWAHAKPRSQQLHLEKPLPCAPGDTRKVSAAFTSDVTGDTLLHLPMPLFPCLYEDSNNTNSEGCCEDSYRSPIVSAL